MRLILIGCGLALACSASAAQHEYEVALKVYADGKLVSSPTITTAKGEETELVQTASAINYKLSLKLTADDKEHPNIGKGINLKMTVNYELGKKDDPKSYRHYQAQPEILVQPGREGSITTGTDKGGDKLMIKVYAKRI
ncbi:MAG: hypothetical protein IT288_14660 [Bdellovibrionales bacterium]|nr:hypothetical protein [Bdellovibrionales bacterium]